LIKNYLIDNETDETKYWFNRFKNSNKYKNEKEKEFDDTLLDLLKIGIGIHNSGLNNKYLLLVEVLFRKKLLRIVFATGTLAYGINMPCKTIIFVEESKFLTPVEYHQMSGRSGRRGIDNESNIIFYKINPNTISNLILSKIPKLKGYITSNISIALRCSILLNQTKNPNNFIKSIKNLLQIPLVNSFKNNINIENQIIYHFRYSFEYLYQTNLINNEGKPISLAGIVQRLWYCEPNNFIIAFLMTNKKFIELCKAFRENKYLKSKKEQFGKLVIILAHLICPLKVY
jgi:hypothetical protein